MAPLAFVTGATGNVGNATAKLLVERGWTVGALVRNTARACEMLPKGVFLAKGDITEAATVTQGLRDFLAANTVVDKLVVFHCAGMPEQFLRDETTFNRVNVEGTRNVLTAALEHKASKVVYTSTQDVFFKDSDGVIVETNIQTHPKDTAYARSKQDAEVMCDEFMKKHGLPIIFINCASVYGPSPVLTGINEMLQKLVVGEMPTLLPGGIPMVYIDGVAKAHIDAVDLGSPGERYLLADRRMSVEDIAQATAQAYAELNPEAPALKIPSVMPAWFVKFLGSTSTFATRRLHIGEKPLVPRSAVDLLLWDPHANTSKAEQSLGFKPHEISDGFRKTITSLAENGFLKPTTAEKLGIDKPAQKN